MAAIDDLKTVVTAMVSHIAGLNAEKAAVEAALAAEKAAHGTTQTQLDGMDAQLTEMKNQLSTAMAS
jgi:hypothetical protein